MGRFINKDPIGLDGGHNLYAFVGNNPMNSWDVRGMLEELEPYYDYGNSDYIMSEWSAFLNYIQYMPYSEYDDILQAYAVGLPYTQNPSASSNNSHGPIVDPQFVDDDGDLDMDALSDWAEQFANNELSFNPNDIHDYQTSNSSQQGFSLSNMVKPGITYTGPFISVSGTLLKIPFLPIYVTVELNLTAARDQKTKEWHLLGSFAPGLAFFKGVNAGIGAFVSNADSIEQLKGPSYNITLGGYDPFGSEVDVSTNARGDYFYISQTFGIGAGPDITISRPYTVEIDPVDTLPITTPPIYPYYTPTF